jgi:hypothetical protein
MAIRVGRSVKKRNLLQLRLVHKVRWPGRPNFRQTGRGSDPINLRSPNSTHTTVELK